MSESKLTKHNILSALSHTKTLKDAASYAGVSRVTLWRAMKRLNLQSKPGKGLANVGSKPAESKAVGPPVVESVQNPPKQERNILRLTADDFSGRNFGEAQSRLDRNSYEERYRRLKW